MEVNGSNTRNGARKILLYSRTPENTAQLCNALRSYSWSGLINSVDCRTIDVSTAFNDFYTIAKWHLDKYIPTRTVVIKEKDPAFITPAIKALLRKRNRLKRRGHLLKADVIANKINSMIVNNRKNALIKANSSNVGQLWALLRKSENWGSKSKKIDCCGNVNDINKYFTSVVYRVAVPTSG